MAKRSVKIIPSVEMFDIADRGKAVGRHEDGRVMFVEGAVPGDVVDVRVLNAKKSHIEGKTERIVKASTERVKPLCKHFGLCGGCKWQNLDYQAQLKYKQQTVVNALQRIGKVEVAEMFPILGAENQFRYRNKLEYTFSNKRWLTKEEVGMGDAIDRRAAGFHLPGHFDKLMDVETCHLQEEPTNGIRNHVKAFAIEHDITFYDIKNKEGYLRNLIVRTSSTGELMVVLSVGYDDDAILKPLLDSIVAKFPEITSLYSVVNPKLNDTISDLETKLYYGKPYIVERLGNAQFQVGPKSFFQTNTAQANRLYETAAKFADLKGTENVFDLYTGLGSIACYIAEQCKQVVGIEEIAPAIDDARVNAKLNGYDHAHFHVGDVKDVLDAQFVEKYGKPDLIITDPPRAGMHPDVVQTLLQINAPRIVYVSCNPATQARDLALMDAQYRVLKSQAVDMFPHTHHIENVVLLERR